MSSIFVRPTSDNVPLPTANSPPAPLDGLPVPASDYVLNLLRAGRATECAVPSQEVMLALSAGTLREDSEITVSRGGGWPDDVAYSQGALTEAYAGLSTVDLLTGEVSLVRNGGLPVGSATQLLSGSGQEAIRTYAWDALRTTCTAVGTLITAGQNGLSDPVTVAAQSNAVTGPVWLRFIPPQNFASRAADAPSPGGTSWKNATFVNAQASELALWTAWLAAYIGAGGKEPTHIAIDLEDNATTYSVTSAPIADKAGNMDAIYLQTPELRAMLGGYATRTDFANAFAGAYPNWTQIWNNAVIELQDRAMRAAYTQPILDVWPDCSVSFYGEYLITPEESNAVKYLTSQYDYQSTIAGTHAAPEMYGLIQNAGTLYGTSAFQIFRWEVARFRAMMRSYPTQRVRPWISHCEYAPPDGYGGTAAAYTREKIYHLILCGADSVLYFNEPSSNAFEDAYMDLAMRDIQSRLGNRPRAALTVAAFNTNAIGGVTSVVSGMSDGTGDYHWRVTYISTATSVTINGVAKVLTPGFYGFWVTTQSSTPPTVVVA